MNLITASEYKSSLYDTLNDMGLLCTEEYRIRHYRENPDNNWYRTSLLENYDINGIGYSGVHFRVPKTFGKAVEVAINGKYINTYDLTWEEDSIYYYGIIPASYGYTVGMLAKIHYNPFIIYQNGFVNADTSDFTVDIDFSSEPYVNVSSPEYAAYYINNGSLKIPSITWLSTTVARFSVIGVKSIDFRIATNIVFMQKVARNEVLYVDRPTSTKCYHHIMIDDNVANDIDVRFYPCVQAKSTGMLRVYNDQVSYLKYPHTSRLINYTEMWDFTDNPYVEANPYYGTLVSCDDVVTESDSDDEIVNKFKNISKYFHNMWQIITMYAEYPNDFIINKNTAITNCFISTQVALFSSSWSGIICTIPYHDGRDILFYENTIFSNYTIKNILQLSTGEYVENDNIGKPTYMIPIGYDISNFTLVKFNTDKDTIITNIGDLIDTENYVRLHGTLKKFYRNLLIVKSQLLELKEDEQVRVSAFEPTTTDTNLWFEMLVEVSPEDFQTRALDIIREYGLDPDAIPTEITDEAYSATIDPSKGPISYIELLAIYRNLALNSTNYSVQSTDGTVVVYNLEGTESTTELPQTIDAGDTLIPILYDQPETPIENAVWCEFLDEVGSVVAYSDDNSMVIKLNDKLIILEFDHDNIEAYAFDDILLSFRGKSYMRYATILSDLINSGEISINDVHVFNTRLITDRDELDPALKRIYLSQPYVITTANIDPSDFFIFYSTNVHRVTLNYADDTIDNTTRSYLYQQIIDLSPVHLGYIPSSTLVFINGKYIPNKDITVLDWSKLKIENFSEKIQIVDVFVTDDTYEINKLISSCPQITLPASQIDITDALLSDMEPIKICGTSYRAYYDILVREVVLSGRLLNDLRYAIANPDYMETFQSNLKHSFADISDRSVFSYLGDDGRIIIPAFAKENPAYVIKSAES